MHTKAIIALAVITLANTVMADFDLLWPAVLWASMFGNRQQPHYQQSKCVHLKGRCTAGRQCCHYRGQFIHNLDTACFSGSCLQTMCGYPGQRCGPYIGECCFHMGLVCTGSGVIGRCLPRVPPQ